MERLGLGQLWYPFLAAGAALLIAGTVLGPVIFWRWPHEQQTAWGLLLGALSCVVLYAVMRAIAERSEK
jgi:hypothetical protein